MFGRRVLQLAGLDAVVPLAVVVALAVCAAARRVSAKTLSSILPAFLQRDFVFENVEFPGERRGDLSGEFIFPQGVTGFHEGRNSSMSIEITIFTGPSACGSARLHSLARADASNNSIRIRRYGGGCRCNTDPAVSTDLQPERTRGNYTIELGETFST